MEKITARTNEKIKYASHLAESASFRRENGEFLLEGARLCADAAQTDFDHDVFPPKMFKILYFYCCATKSC